jgi:hypothetical protein
MSPPTALIPPGTREHDPSEGDRGDVPSGILRNAFDLDHFCVTAAHFNGLFHMGPSHSAGIIFGGYERGKAEQRDQQARHPMAVFDKPRPCRLCQIVGRQLELCQPLCQECPCLVG